MWPTAVADCHLLSSFELCCLTANRCGPEIAAAAHVCVTHTHGTRKNHVSHTGVKFHRRFVRVLSTVRQANT